ncbi:MAG TPA: methyltransferase [Polyangiales bacterium]|jgi:tRNA1(Val) A37 N6-methylase TrmN6|nr:methyltransferase [Polyangiales bacterium]
MTTLPLSLPPDDLTDDALTDRVRVLQRRNGHRYSVDDVATAWLALRAMPGARSSLDLGCGIGSVLLMIADRLQKVRAVGVEAQAGSYALAERNVEKNQLGRRVSVQYGDLRDPALLDRILQAQAAFGHEGGFDLVTGTPPYKPLGTASLSPDSQRAHARVELRGGVEAYLAAAARVLAPEGVFVMCAQNEQAERVASGACAVNLLPIHRVDVIPMRERKGRLFSVYAFVHATRSDAGAAIIEQLRAQPLVAAEPGASEVLVLRDEHGARTPEACALRAFFGLISDPSEPASPPKRLDDRRVASATSPNASNRSAQENVG